MKNTAMEVLIEALKAEISYIKDSDSIYDRHARNGLMLAKDKAEQLLEKEKRIIVEADNGYVITKFLGATKGEQYYSYTFKKD